MINIYICMGSACYLKGSGKVVEIIKKEIEREDLEAKVHLKGSFCLGPCNRGVVVKVEEKVFCNFNPENAMARFHTEIMKYIEEYEAKVVAGDSNG